VSRTFIVVDSGSTKADWVVFSKNGSKTYSTQGFNPYFHTEDEIVRALRKCDDLMSLSEEVDEINFYGAGCSSQELNQIIQKALERIFTKAKVNVDHDLTASALACYQGKPEIACILGTGSNSCFYDGNTMYQSVPALGYILGDEGSGSYFGKALLRDFLYKRLPDVVHDELTASGLTHQAIIENVYQRPNANVYIASFMPFIINHKDLPYFQGLIAQGLGLFLENHVMRYENHQSVEVNFVGSLAFLLKDELQQQCNTRNIHIGRILRRPIESLVNYHKNLNVLTN